MTAQSPQPGAATQQVLGVFLREVWVDDAGGDTAEWAIIVALLLVLGATVLKLTGRLH